MELQDGDWVRTESGEIGKIVHIYRLSAFLHLEDQGNDKEIKSFLLSTLTKIEPPNNDNTTAS